MSITKTGWRISNFCDGICVIHDAKGREVCKTPSKEIAEYIKLLAEEYENAKKKLENAVQTMKNGRQS